jgi:hypothetical protein
MSAATAYVLHVPEGRRDIILNYAEENRHDATRYVAEPVPSFSYGSNALAVLACFRDGAITHIADGRKGMSAGDRVGPTQHDRVAAIGTAPSI